MTCIVALEDNGVVWMGGDSAGIDQHQDKIALASPKVFQRGELLIGATGDSRFLQSLKYAMALEPIPKVVDPEEWLAGVYVETMRAALRKTGAMGKDSEGREACSNSIVGLRGRAYVIDSGFGVVRSTNGYEATGSGSPYALGALRALAHVSEKFDPAECVNIALEAAAHHCATVMAPFTILDGGCFIEPACVCGHYLSSHADGPCAVTSCKCTRWRP